MVVRCSVCAFVIKPYRYGRWISRSRARNEIQYYPFITDSRALPLWSRALSSRSLLEKQIVNIMHMHIRRITLLRVCLKLSRPSSAAAARRRPFSEIWALLVRFAPPLVCAALSVLSAYFRCARVAHTNAHAHIGCGGTRAFAKISNGIDILDQRSVPSVCVPYHKYHTSSLCWFNTNTQMWHALFRTMCKCNRTEILCAIEITVRPSVMSHMDFKS